MKKLFCSCGVTRRNFLSSLAGLGAASVLPTTAQAQSAPAIIGNRDRIDTHHHFFAPTLVAEMVSKKIAQKPALDWSLKNTLDDMDAAGTKTSILSATTPQVSFLDAQMAKKLRVKIMNMQRRLQEIIRVDLAPLRCCHYKILTTHCARLNMYLMF